MHGKIYLSCLPYPTLLLFSEKDCFCDLEPCRAETTKTGKLGNWGLVSGRTPLGEQLCSQNKHSTLVEITTGFSITHASEVIKSMVTLMSVVFCLKCVLLGRKCSEFRSQRTGSQWMFCCWWKVMQKTLGRLPPPSALSCCVQSEEGCGVGLGRWTCSLEGQHHCVSWLESHSPQR